MAESWKNLKPPNMFLSSIVCSNQNRSALVRELSSDNSLFFGQLYENKSLVLHTHDLIFTNDFQIVNYYSIFRYIQLIYFLNIFLSISFNCVLGAFLSTHNNVLFKKPYLLSYKVIKPSL